MLEPSGPKSVLGSHSARHVGLRSRHRFIAKRFPFCQRRFEFFQEKKLRLFGLIFLAATIHCGFICLLAPHNVVIHGNPPSIHRMLGSPQGVVHYPFTFRLHPRIV